MAQSVEQLICNLQVMGSSPFTSSRKKQKALTEISVRAFFVPMRLFLPGLSVRYPGRTANDPSFAHGHDARSGRENARSARQRNDIPVQTIPRLPWRMTRRPEPAVVTGRDTRGRPWWKAWIWSVLSSAMAIR